MLLDAIILNCSHSFKNERSTSAVLHLLNGKQSIQTIQDCRTYQLDSFYGIYPTLHKHVFDQKLHELVKHQLLFPISPKQGATPTLKGLNWMRQVNEQSPIHQYNGLALYKTDYLFYARLLLIIQVLTNKKMHESSYIPIIEDHTIFHWVKNVYLKTKPDIDKHLRMIHDELRLLLRQEDERNAQLFVDRMTSYRHYGMSLEQLSVTYQIDLYDVPLILTAVIHRMINHIKEKRQHFPFMSYLLHDLSTEGMISQSTMQTYEMIKKQYPLEQIALKRRLKMSTIYDHIVEITLYDREFSIQPYVSHKNQLEIINAVKQNQTFKLKTIKEHVSEDISYFQIRLTLAKANLKNGIGEN